MYRLYVNDKPTPITTESKIGAWDLVENGLWQEHYPNRELPSRWRAKFVKEEVKQVDENFDSLSAKEKVKLLVRVLNGFHELELCILCGRKTKSGDRYMIALDGRWPDHYHNLWRCKECKSADKTT